MTLPRLLACALALGLALPAAAQAPLAPTSPEAHADDAPDEGIHVSGAWTITVREPDGSLVERRDFNNSLTQIGSNILASIMSSNETPGFWEISLTSGSDTNGRPCGDDIPSDCKLVPANISDLSGPITFGNLQIANDDSRIQLSGSIVVQQDGSTIGRVDTALSTCDRSTTAETCSETETFTKSFTSKVLTPDKMLSDLREGQIVSVEVKIGFGSASE